MGEASIIYPGSRVAPDPLMHFWRNMKSLLIFFLLNFSNMTGCHVYKPKFEIGDCIVARLRGDEIWDEDKFSHRKVLKVGRDHYWLVGESDVDFHFDISYIDSEYNKEICL